MSYTDYLQRRELDGHLAFQITEPIKELITQGDSIAHAQLSQLQQIETAQAETTAAVYVVAQAVEDLRHETEQGFRRVGAILEWGFSELIFQQSRTNDLLSDILHALKTPSLTWAYEQFERARDRYRRGHYIEALESLDKALEGHANELGDKTEHRFHHLRGTIKLGSFRNHDSDVVNLSEAEESFVKAAHYAKHDYPADAAKALLCAARAANLEGRFDTAKAHAARGLQYAPLAGLHYEFSVAAINLNAIEEAGEHLQSAIRLEKSLLLRAIGDSNFREKNDFLQRNLEALLDQLRAIAQELAKNLKQEIEAMDNTYFESLLIGKSFSLRKISKARRDQISNYCSNMDGNIISGGILDIRSVIEKFGDIITTLQNCDKYFRENISTSVDVALAEKREEERQSIAKILKSKAAIKDAMPFIVPTGGIIIGIIGFNYFYEFGDFYPAERFMYSLVYSIGIGFIGFFMAGAIANIITDSLKRSSERASDASRRRMEGFSDSASRDKAATASGPIYSPNARLEQILPAWILRTT